MKIWHDMPAKRITPEDFWVLIEISKGGKNKYELDKETGCMILDRILYTSTHYPANYGFIPRTYALDNDPIDVLVLSSEPIVPLALVDAYPIGMLVMEDQGKQDEKIIAIAKGDPFYNAYKDIKELPQHILMEVSHFFSVYKQLEDKITMVHQIEGKDKAEQAIAEAIKRYNEKFDK